MNSEPCDPQASQHRLARRLRHQVGRAIADFRMIEDGDRIMVCLSGGKDSWTLLDILRELQQCAPVRFDLIAVHLDQKQPGYDAEILPAYLKSQDVPFHVIEQDTYSVVQRLVPEGRTTCSLCSRLRRGALYEFAAANNCSRIALGHHRDDIVETFFLNLFHQGRLKAMPPKLRSDDGRNVLIRPLAYCSEADIAEYSRQRDFPILPCNLCGSQPNLQRGQIKAMLAEWEKQSPGRTENIFRALTRVDPSQLADPALFDFVGLQRNMPGPSPASDPALISSTTAAPWIANRSDP